MYFVRVWGGTYQVVIMKDRLSVGEDICDVYANQDDYNLGWGVFSIEEYSISHPNCLCYATQEQPNLDDIINRVNNWVDGGEDEELENS